ncbi:MAG: tail fiber domain-containing protein, partial [Bacteroidota bacterium]
GIMYQGIARDVAGVSKQFVNLNVGIRILDPSDVVVYEETHVLTTDQYGLFKCVIGQGSVVSGTFSSIDWNSGQFKVQPVLDGTPLTVQNLQSVPYALTAEEVDMDLSELADVDLTGLAANQVLQYDGSQWVPGAGGNTVWSQNDNSAYYNGGRIGVGVDAPLTAFHMADTANVLLGDSLTGEGFKLIWYAPKGALRFGYLSNPFGGYNYNRFWDYDSVGFFSFAGGQNSRAKGFGAFAWGSFGWADGSGSVAFYGNARGNNSYTFGGNSKGRGSFTVEGTAEEEGGIAMYGYTGGRYGVSIGGGTTGLGASSSREDYAIAIGWNSDARGQASIALGPSDAYGYNSFSTGWVTEARGNYSSTFGYHTNSYPYASMALGRFNTISGDSASWVSSDPIFMIGDGTGTAARSNSFMIQKNGQTAIGYDAPTGMLHVSDVLGTLNNGGTLDPTRATLLLGDTSGGLAFDQNQIESIGSPLYVNFNSAEDFNLVNGGGQVGIGLSNPTDKLHVSAAAGEDAVRVQVGGTTAFRVHDNLGVSLGANLNPPANGLYVEGESIINGVLRPNDDGASDLGSPLRKWGDIYAINGVIQTSDARLKTNILPIAYGLSTVLSLQPVSFNWKTDQSAETKLGLLAQEVQELIPEVVKGSPNEEVPLGIQYADLIPVLIQAIKDQQQTIDKFQQVNQEQEDKISAIRKELETLKALILSKNE